MKNQIAKQMKKTRVKNNLALRVVKARMVKIRVERELEVTKVEVHPVEVNLEKVQLQVAHPVKVNLEVVHPVEVCLLKAHLMLNLEEEKDNCLQNNQKIYGKGTLT